MMGMSLVDGVFWGIFLVLVLIVARMLREPYSYSQFKEFFMSPLATVAFVVFMWFYAIALIDCVRFEDGSTVLDWLVQSINRSELTFSSPLARDMAVATTDVVDGKFYFNIEPLANITHLSNSQVWVQSLSFGLFGLLFLLPLVHFRKHSVLFGSLALMAFISLASYKAGSLLHLLGTGQIGDDVFYHALKSVRTAMVIGLVTPLVMAPIAILLGIAAGYFGGLVDDAIQYLYTVISAIPGVLLIAAFALFLQQYISLHEEAFPNGFYRADARLLGLCMILALTSWTGIARLLRAETLKLKELDMCQAAKVLGSGSVFIMWRHILPNVMPIFIVTISLDFSGLVLSEAVLSYIGIGVDPSTPSFGMLINSARMDLARTPIIWWNLFASFFFLLTIVLSANIIADRAQAVLDPRRASVKH